MISVSSVTTQRSTAVMQDQIYAQNHKEFSWCTITHSNWYLFNNQCCECVCSMGTSFPSFPVSQTTVPDAQQCTDLFIIILAYLQHFDNYYLINTQLIASTLPYCIIFCQLGRVFFLCSLFTHLKVVSTFSLPSFIEYVNN